MMKHHLPGFATFFGEYSDTGVPRVFLFRSQAGRLCHYGFTLEP